MVKHDEPLDVGICRSGPYAGSWISGPSELVTRAAFDIDEHQMFSWSWEFQPFQAEFDLPVALKRRQALDLLGDWRVDWVSPDLARLARAMLFDDTGFEERQAFFGLRKEILLRSIDEVSLVTYSLPLKLQSVRSAITFVREAEEYFPQITQRDGVPWAVAAGELLGGGFIEVDRRGWFAQPEEVREGSNGSIKRESGSESPFHGNVVARARQLAGSERCLAFVPNCELARNEVMPVAPWAWLQELRDGGPERRCQ